MNDPRKADTHEEACQNPDGTYSAINLLSWLSETLNPGKGIPAEEVREMAEEAIRKRKAQNNGNQTSTKNNRKREEAPSQYDEKR